MRIGVIWSTAVVGLVAVALTFVPLALRHARPLPPLPPADLTSSFWAIPIFGGQPRLVARLTGQYEFPVASADGRSVLVQKPTMLGKTALWSVPLGKGSPQWVGTVPQFTELSWSQDRKRFAYGDGRVIAVYDVATRRARTVTRFHGEGGGSSPSLGGRNLALVRMTHPMSGWHLDVELWRASGGLIWSRPLAYPNGSVTLAPDGRRIALLQVHRLQLLTRRGRRLLATDAAQGLPKWTPDGRSVVYFDLKQRLLVQDVATGARRVLATGTIAEPSVSPDGRTIYVKGFRGEKPAVSIPK